jgi:quinol-cytochrome oxidoreductase complex cytochrome b subunit
MIYALPLTILPLIVYNVVGYSLSGADPWSNVLLGITMLSGQVWSLKLGDLLITFAIIILFFEVMKAARSSTNTISNHVLSTIVLIIYVVEFIVAGVAAHSVFFILTVIALFDVIAGFSITIKTATRDIALGQNVDAV